MKRYLRWIVAAEFLFAAGNLHAVEVEVPGLLTDHTVSSIGHDFYRAFSDKWEGNDSNLLIVFYVQIMPDDFVMQLHRF